MGQRSRHTAGAQTGKRAKQTAGLVSPDLFRAGKCTGAGARGPQLLSAPLSSSQLSLAVAFAPRAAPGERGVIFCLASRLLQPSSTKSFPGPWQQRWPLRSRAPQSAGCHGQGWTTLQHPHPAKSCPGWSSSMQQGTCLGQPCAASLPRAAGGNRHKLQRGKF